MSKQKNRVNNKFKFIKVSRTPNLYTVDILRDYFLFFGGNWADEVSHDIFLLPSERLTKIRYKEKDR